MDSAEFSELIAYTRYFEALPDSWRETGLLAAALCAPHTPRHRKPLSPDEFIPLLDPPRHESQDMDAIRKLREALGMSNLNNDV